MSLQMKIATAGSIHVVALLSNMVWADGVSSTACGVIVLQGGPAATNGAPYQGTGCMG